MPSFPLLFQAEKLQLTMEASMQVDDLGAVAKRFTSPASLVAVLAHPPLWYMGQLYAMPGSCAESYKS